MLNSNDLDFSFSGLKTAVLYQVREHQQLTDWLRERIAADFEDAVTDVVIRKVEMAFERYPSHTFLLGGGVSANCYLRERLTKLFQAHYTDVALRIPAPGLSTDNAVMVGMAAYLDHLRGLPTKTAQDDLRAEGNLAIDG
jgi:N6-L-threonylcarbamoyladenine synthase